MSQPLPTSRAIQPGDRVRDVVRHRMMVDALTHNARYKLPEERIAYADTRIDGVVEKRIDEHAVTVLWDRVEMTGAAKSVSPCLDLLLAVI